MKRLVVLTSSSACRVGPPRWSVRSPSTGD